MAPLLHHLSFSTALFSLLLRASAYIPAIPTNDTALAIQNGLNVTDVSRVILQWYSVAGLPGGDSQFVSYQIVGQNTNGISKGALVRFSEDDANNSTTDITATPWIALVACDANASHTSQDVNVFSIASDRGAVGGLLYSEWSSACIINRGYKDTNIFTPLIDIFTTQSLASARVILGQFSAINISVYGEFNVSTLNASQSAINETLMAGHPTEPGYIWATLAAYNATGPLGINSSGGGNQSTPVQFGSGEDASKGRNITVVILFSCLGGFIVWLFAAIIFTKIRAIWHPERYCVAAEAADAIGGGRGGVLTRAILNAFAFIKFGARHSETEGKDLEAEGDGRHPGHEMRDNLCEPAETAEKERAQTAASTSAGGSRDAPPGAGSVEDSVATVPCSPVRVVQFDATQIFESNTGLDQSEPEK